MSSNANVSKSKSDSNTIDNTATSHPGAPTTIDAPAAPAADRPNSDSSGEWEDEEDSDNGGDDTDSASGADEDESRSTLQAFVVQACAGPLMGLLRLTFDGAEMSDEIFANRARVFYCRYLNQIWMSLLRDDDDYVTENVAKVAHRSPVCLIYAMKALGFHALPSECIEVGFSGNMSTEDKMNAIRPTIHAMVADELKTAGKLWDSLNHECSGKSLAEERAEWHEKGCPEEEFFQFS